MSHPLRDKLIAAEPEDSGLRQEYERRLAMLLETHITWYRRTGLIVGTIVCLATAVIAGIMAVQLRHHSLNASIGIAIAGVLALLGAGITARILFRGTYRRDRDSTAQAGIIWAFIVVMVTTFMLIGGIDSIRGVGLTVVGVVFLIGAGVLLLRTVIEQSELRTREKLLEMELRLTRISDELAAIRRERHE